MKNKKGSLRDSKNHWLLHPSIPDIDLPIAQLIREVNTIHSIPFGYTGTALLSPEGQMYAKGLFELVRAQGAGTRLNIGILQEFAFSFGGELLSDEYVKSQHEYSWRCSEGHVFKQRYSNMKHRSQFCPICEGRQSRKKGLRK